MDLSWKRITARLQYPFRIARPGSSVGDDGTRIERIIVSIEHEGITGWGEAAPTPYYQQSLESVEQTLASARPMLANMTPDIDAVVDLLLSRFGDQRATVAAVDAALHDWNGKRIGQPVWRMLGLDIRKTPPTSYTIGIDSPDVLQKKMATAAPFECLKIKVGTDSDAETLTTLRKIAPNKKIRVDANCGWPAEQLAQRIEAIAGFDLELIEQPTKAGQFEAVATARRCSPIPLIADEDSVVLDDVAKLAGVYDGINVKLSKCGGIREAVRMIASARAFGLRVMLGCMAETSLGVSAAAQIASLCDFVDLDGHLLLSDDPHRGLRLEQDVVLPSDQPGLGIDVR